MLKEQDRRNRGVGGKGAIAPLPQILAGIEAKPSPLKGVVLQIAPTDFRPSYGPEEEEERKEALTLAHIRVHIFVSNLRISVTENRTQSIECQHFFINFSCTALFCVWTSC